MGARDEGSIAAGAAFAFSSRAGAASRLEQLTGGLGSGGHVVHWNGRAQDPGSAAAELLAQATGSRPREPLFALAAYLMHLRSRSERLVVVIDDLDALPPRIAQWLRGALDSSDGALRVVAAAANDAAAERAAARLGLALTRPRRPAPVVDSRRHWWLGLATFALLAVLAAFLTRVP